MPEEWRELMADSSNVVPISARVATGSAEAPPGAAAETPLSVLIIDDAPEDRMVVRLALESQGYLLSEVDNGERGIAAAAAINPDCILLDNRLPDLDGIEVIEGLRRADGTMPCAVVVMTGSSDGRTAAKLLKAGALDYLDKRFLGEDSLRRAVQGAVDRYRFAEQQRTAEERNAQLAAIVSSSADAVFSIGGDVLVRSWNRGAEAIFGFAESEIVGRSADDLLVPAHKREELEHLYHNVFERKLAQRTETECRHKDGRLVPVEIYASPMLAGDGQVMAASLIMRDITDRHRAERALQTRNAQLLQIARASSLLVLKSSEGASGPQSVLAELAEALDYELFFQYDADVSKRLLRLASSKGVTPEQRDAFGEIRFGQYLCGTVADRREPVIVHRLEESTFPEACALRDAGVTFYAGFPLLADGVLLGTVAFATRSRDQLDEGELQHIQTLCDLAANQIARARIDAALRASEARLSLFVEHAPAAIAMFDRDMCYIAASRRYGVDYGLADGVALAGRSHYDVFPDLQPHWRQIHARVLAGERLSREDDPFLHADGRTDWVNWTMTPWRAPDGSVGGALLFSEVRTAQVEAQRALAKSEARFRSVIRSHTELLCRFRIDGTLTLVNEAYADTFGRTPAEPEGTNFYDLMPQADRGFVRESLASLSSDHPTSTVVHRVLCADGTVRVVEWTNRRLFPPDGDSDHYQAVGRDVTDRTLAEDSLRESERRLQLALQASATGVWDYDLASGRVTWSGHIHPIFGIEQFGGTTEAFFDLVHPDDRDRLGVAVEAALSDGTLQAEFRIIRPDGEVRWVNDHAILVRDAAGRPARLLGTINDITERKRHEEHTDLLLQEVNHRAKNMLALIQAVARLTAKTDPDEFVERFSRRLHALAANQDLLVKGNWRAVPLEELVRSQLAHFGRAGARVTLDGPPVEVTASASQTLGMALHELATNAAKYGALSDEAGRVAVCWDMRPDAVGTAQFTLSWTERGGPRVEQPSRRGFGSTVIGDMIKNSLGCDAEIDFAPDGVVWRVHCSAAGVLEGCSARPTKQPDDATAAPAAGHALGRRVLVVEDEPLIAMEIDESLQDAGFKVLGPANSVAEALSLLDQGGCDVAVLDINLGTETSEPIARELIRVGTPFITMSGYSREQQPEIMKSAPSLSKPLRTEQLIAEIERHLRVA